jgi:glutathione S-transferase
MWIFSAGRHPGRGKVGLRRKRWSRNAFLTWRNAWPDANWLEDRFTAGDLMIATVLRILRHTDLVTSDPTLAPYLARCEARPGFQKALSDQMASFIEADADQSERSGLAAIH